MALAVTAVVAVVMLLFGPHVSQSLGDPDDAVRLSMVRDLLHGKGWFDEKVDRLQPPLGVYMHWSRLVDGGLALTDRILGLFVSPEAAERGMRTVWPMLWIAPSALAMLYAARKLAPPAAAGASVVACALLLLVADPFLYAQFIPGRIDHHNIQIALSLVVAAGAIADGAAPALIAGLATGLGLAIGFEGMFLEAVCAAAIAVRFVVDPGQARPLVFYAVGLMGALSAAFLAQTPPARLSVVMCDALAVNMVAVVLVGGAGLIAASFLTRSRDWRWRLAAVGVAAAMSLGLFLSLKSACVFGPLADVDPRVRPFWFNDIMELRSFATLARTEPSALIIIATPLVFGVVALALLFRLRRDRPVEPSLIVWSLLLAVGIALGASAERMSFYALWLAVPPIAALAGEILLRRKDSGWLPTVTISLLLSPLLPTAALALGLETLSKPPADLGAPDRCMVPSSFATLAKLPPGLVVGDIDLGPYVLATTRSSALSAPYHRMTWGILANETILEASDREAEARARAVGAAYVLECRAHARHLSRTKLSTDALQRRLDQGRPPGWLEPLSPPGSPLEVYRVRPAAPAR